MECAKKKTMILFDARDWMSSLFWIDNSNMSHCADPWKELRDSDHRVKDLVSAAGNADFELVVVIATEYDFDIYKKYKDCREIEIKEGRTRMCLGAESLLAESFENHGVRVVRPIGADTVDAMAALADSVKDAIILSRNARFPRLDKPLLVCRGYTVSDDGKLILTCPMARFRSPPSNSYRWTTAVHPGLARSYRAWSTGIVARYRPSLRKKLRVDFGVSSSTDRRMRNLHVIARPLRAAVYAILEEKLALERIPQWSNEERMVEWIETIDVAERDLVPVLEQPLSVVEWIVDHDTAAENLEPWRAAERHFNICCLAAELLAVSSKGTRTMHDCMELFSNEPDIVNRSSRGFQTSCESQNIGINFANPTRNEPAIQLDSSQPKLLPGTMQSSVEVTRNQKRSSTSKSRFNLSWMYRFLRRPNSASASIISPVPISDSRLAARTDVIPPENLSNEVREDFGILVFD